MPLNLLSSPAGRSGTLRRARAGILAAGVGVGLAAGSGAGCSSAPPDLSLNQCEAGVRAADMGRWEEAEFRWLKALAIDAGSACAHNNLAVSYERDGRWSDAEASYLEALEDVTSAERDDVFENYSSFKMAREGTEADSSELPAGGGGSSEAIALREVRRMEITVAVPELEEGVDLSDVRRILVGNFVVSDDSDSDVDLDALAVRYFRRRLVQRTFFQTVDLLDVPLNSGLEDPLQDGEMWVERMSQADAQAAFSGRLSLTTTNESRVVTEQIRTASGEVREVARFREITGYSILLNWVVLADVDGRIIREGEAGATREFAVGEGVSANEAVVETFEELLPLVLDGVRAKRTEQTRYLIY